MGDQLTYENFDLLIEPGSRRRYRARVVHSPAGESDAVEFTLPSPLSSWKTLCLRLAGPATAALALADPKALR